MQHWRPHWTQRKVLYQRLKVPPALNQFTNTLDKNQATELCRLLSKYQPETKAAKKQLHAQIERAPAIASELEKKPAKHCFKTRLDMACHLSEIACAGLLENVVAEHHQHTQALPTRLTNHNTPTPYQTRHSRLGTARVHQGRVGACLSWCAALGDPLERRRHRLLMFAQAMISEERPL